METRLVVRACTQELESWKAAAGRAGMTLSAWVKWLCTREMGDTGIERVPLDGKAGRGGMRVYTDKPKADDRVHSNGDAGRVHAVKAVEPKAIEAKPVPVKKQTKVVPAKPVLPAVGEEAELKTVKKPWHAPKLKRIVGPGVLGPGDPVSVALLSPDEYEKMREVPNLTLGTKFGVSGAPGVEASRITQEELKAVPPVVGWSKAGSGSGRAVGPSFQDPYCPDGGYPLKDWPDDSFCCGLDWSKLEYEHGVESWDIPRRIRKTAPIIPPPVLVIPPPEITALPEVGKKPLAVEAKPAEPKAEKPAWNRAITGKNVEGAINDLAKLKGVVVTPMRMTEADIDRIVAETAEKLIDPNPTLIPATRSVEDLEEEMERENVLP